SPGTYTFGAGPGPGNVIFWQSGLVPFGGDVDWDPGNGGDYFLNGDLGFGVSYLPGDTCKVNFGSPTGRLLLTGDRMTWGGGRAVMNFAVGDNGAPHELSMQSAIHFTQPASGGVLTGETRIRGDIAVSDMDQVYDGNLNISRPLILDGISWADFCADRSGGYGSGQNQWQLSVFYGGFAARHATDPGWKLVIDDSGSTTSSFDTDFTLGSYALFDGVLYANRPVEVTRDTTLSAERTIRVATTAPGLTGAPGSGFVHTYSGDLSGTGSLMIGGWGPSTDATNGELVLSGLNNWTGTATDQVSTGVYFSSGPGGLAVTGYGYVRFDGDASLPTGNGGSPAYIASIQSWDIRGSNGFLLTGSGGGQTYDLPAGYKFAIGALGIGNSTGTFGSTGGDATLRGSSVLVHGVTVSSSQGLNLLVRDGTLTLGEAGLPVAFEPSTGEDAADPGLSGPATTVSDRNAGSSTLVKHGQGTLILGNVLYQYPSGPDATANTYWEIGRGLINSPADPYFDGAVRETGSGSADSLVNFNLYLMGGVLETSGALNRVLGSLPGQVRWNAGGGGFAAYGSDLVVDLNTIGFRDFLTWGIPPFVPSGNPLMFGSPTADATVEFFDNINLNGGEREFRVFRGTGSAPEARITGVVNGGGFSRLLKTGDGTLEIAADCIYSDATTVAAGTLLVNGSLSVRPLPVTVQGGATLGGTGVINRPVIIEDGGSIAPGASIGTLSVVNLVSMAGPACRLEVELGAPVACDLLAVAGSLTVNGVVNVSDAGGMGVGTYTIATYGGALVDNGLTLAPLPGSYVGVLDYSQPGEIRLNVYAPGTVFVTITATDATANEEGQATGEFTVARTGSPVGDLTVDFTVATGGGMATEGTDYETIGTTVVIPAGQPSATIAVTPVDDSEGELDDDVTITVVDG
ncbi:MAG: hypothetical protein ACYSU0_15835, partial [Planctomycetota bacterium]